MFARKYSLEDLPKEMTAVWTCTNNDCKGWMRDDFSFAKEPDCIICGSSMNKSMKELPVVHNHPNVNYHGTQSSSNN